MRILLAFMLMALPATAQDCFVGLPKRVTYDSGKVATVIQRHGEEIMYTEPYPGGNDVENKTHLVLFPRQTRLPNRFLEYKWADKLPALAALVPGFHFDVAGGMTSDKNPSQPYRITGDVLASEAVMIGKCRYATLVIASKTYIGDVEVLETTVHFSPDMLVILQTTGTRLADGKSFATRAVGLE